MLGKEQVKKMTRITLLITAGFVAVGSMLLFCHSRAYLAGWNDAKADVPGCLYIDRDASACRPWGCDGKEGVDVRTDNIKGGGRYVSLEMWKRTM